MAPTQSPYPTSTVAFPDEDPVGRCTKSVTRLVRFTFVVACWSLCLRFAVVVASHSARLDSRWLAGPCRGRNCTSWLDEASLGAPSNRQVGSSRMGWRWVAPAAYGVHRRTFVSTWGVATRRPLLRGGPSLSLRLEPDRSAFGETCNRVIARAPECKLFEQPLKLLRCSAQLKHARFGSGLGEDTGEHCHHALPSQED